jgi:DNA-directed RNA polymerase specialized sigma24 family protein
MDERNWLAKQFEENRAHLRAVAYRMLGSPSEADDAVQESWLRLSRSEASSFQNLGGWLTTVVARVCLDMLRSRKSRGEESPGARVTEAVGADEGIGPEGEALLADSIGPALLVVRETLGASGEVRGAPAVADTFKGRAQAAQAALVNGAAGAVWAPGGRPRVVFGFKILGRKIVEINLLADPDRLRQLKVVQDG